MTVADLIDNPSLDSRLLSGGSGLDRTVLWAHSCEMPHPERWLGPHELLMTIGLCIPQDAQAQREFIAGLDEAGLAGIAVGEHGLAPRLTNAMLAESDARGFPILATHPDTPFAAIGRTVAAANADNQTMGVLLLAKLYQIAGQRDAASRRSGADLGDLFGTSLTVFDEATGCILVGEGLLAPSVSRAHSLRTHRPSRFFVEEDSALDGFALMHLAQVLAVDVNTIIQEAMERIGEGAAALELALSGRKEGQAALLSAWGGTSGAFRAVVTACDVELRVPLALVLAGVRLAVLESAERIVLAFPVHELERVKTIL
ncbi:MAG TPA: PucR family transcriptional regulator ligand-binding domain-containing protein, partial [Arthrobacter sp.]|nr:PucR family transcriptional regulator ligand-binding domain-containing protein [Arthrobacter sp.]